jgi:hypothetical protein
MFSVPTDPAAVRLLMMRRLLASSVRHYRAALDFARDVDLAMPPPFRPPFDPEAEPEGERREWWNLLYEADSEFYAAESALADRLHNLYDSIASEADRIGPTPVGDPFVERAVSLDGALYVLTDDPGNYDAGHSIIAIVRTDRVIGLDD